MRFRIPRVSLHLKAKQCAIPVQDRDGAESDPVHRNPLCPRAFLSFSRTKTSILIYSLQFLLHYVAEIISDVPQTEVLDELPMFRRKSPFI